METKTLTPHDMYSQITRRNNKCNSHLGNYYTERVHSLEKRDIYKTDKALPDISDTRHTGNLATPKVVQRAASVQS